ncbi:TIGR04219 family outer membrane beta-barrel protein [Marinobacter caseinilyticus]|uniref:TIGR04219 family outer membrane beta-barrel protein n=1 Tax=Marinobacter caseinilyticus TaxID=2692195 RepID=UPI00140D379D|nr:TIGR04219 family outer membrane beta-barrel protein [Marinobacter caseinilyticus]
MRKLILVAGTSLLIAAPFASADVVGLGASVSYWDSELSGQAVNKGSAVDVEDELNLDSDSNANLSAYLEHPVPVLPNVRLNYTSIKQTGRGEVSSSGFDLIGSGAQVDSKLELDQIDVTLYYELLDNWVNLDAGLTVRSLDGELLVEERFPGNNASRTEIKAVLPMGYLAARFDLPLTGVSIGAEGNGISYSGDSIFDYNAYAQYEVSVVQLRAGYRQMSVDYEDGDDKLDIDIDGPFASLGVTF